MSQIADFLYLGQYFEGVDGFKEDLMVAEQRDFLEEGSLLFEIVMKERLLFLVDGGVVE